MRRKEGDTVILDNGAYEGTIVQPAQLHHIAKELKPTVLVLPDVPGDMLRTIQHSMDYLETYGLPHGVEGMMVLHGRDGHIAEFMAMYITCPVKWVGFSRLTKRYTDAKGIGGGRCDFINLLQFHGKWRPELTHHALGMSSGDVEEVKRLRALGVNSCDSSSPIWRGLNGYRIDDQGWPNYSFDPGATDFARNGMQLAEENLMKVLEACDVHF